MRMDVLEYIYGQLKDKYNLTLTSAFSLNAGFTEDYKVLCGESDMGKFWLYDDGDLLVFSAENTGKGDRTHWHPFTASEALDDVAGFMEGTLTF